MSFQHTIVLIQFESNDTCTRTYVDFDSVPDAMDGIAQIFEQRIQLKPGKPATYVMSDLVAFIEQLADLSCLVWEEAQKIYIPYGKDWIKSRLYMYLKRYATKKI
jgi:hypothetical protein